MKPQSLTRFSPRLLPLVACIILLAGCANLAPKYEQPKVLPVPESWGLQAQEQGASTQAQVLSWQAFILDERLRRLVTQALENNRDMRIAALNVQRTRDMYRIERANQTPTVAVGSSLNRQGDMGAGPGVSNQYNVELGATAFELDFFGRLQNLSDAALEQFLATEQAQATLKNALVGQIGQAYLSYATNQSLLTLARKTYDAQSQSLKMIEQSAQFGAATELDVQQATIPVQAARVDVARYETLAMQDLNALRWLVGAEVSEHELPGALPQREAIFEGFTTPLYSDALLRRPDIKEAEHRLRAAHANIGAARAALFPRITLTTAIGTASQELSGLFDQGVWRFAPRIDLPIFDRGARLARVRVSEADQGIAQANYEKRIQVAFKEVADELARRATLDNQLDAQLKLEAAARRYHELSEHRFKRGMDSFFSVLDAQRSLYAAEQGSIELRGVALLNQLKLYTSLGLGQS